MPEQLVLPVQLPLSISFDDFIGEQNEPALRHLKTSLQEAPEPILLYWGHEATGKTHLLIASCCFLNQEKKTTLYFDLDDYQNLAPEIFDNLEQIQLLAIDNIEQIQGILKWEEALFNCFNQMRQLKIPLLISSRISPEKINYQRDDLTAHLFWGPIYQLADLNGEEIEQVLLRIINQRGLNFSPAAIHYLLTQSQYNLKNLVTMVETLDLISLQEKRRITIALIKESI